MVVNGINAPSSPILPAEPATASTPTDFASLPGKYGWQTENGRGYKIREQLHGTARPLRVLALGAGSSGICLAKFLPEQLKNVQLTIYDKNPDYGGTWYENRYPGCACDIPSHIYQFSWAKNPNWSQYYSGAPEILQYFKDVVHHHNLEKYIHLRHEIVGAFWNESRGVWDVQVKNLETGEAFISSAEVLINCSGILNAWNWPDIKGLSDFKGKLCHTANYDTTIDLQDKRVAVVGIGSSGVQVIPAILPEVSKLYSWIRQPTWMTAGFAQKWAGPNGSNVDYTPEQQQHFRNHPDEYLEHCKELESEISHMFPLFMRGSPESAAAKKFSIERMTQQLHGRKDILEKILPTKFSVGCRRPTPGNGFLEALTSPKMTAFLEPLHTVTEKGFVDSEGHEHEIDVLICATGFDTSWVPRFPVVANGLNLQDIQAKRPTSYLAMAVPGMPNYFSVGGPYFSFGHGSYISMVELFINNILQVINKMQKEDIKSVAPTREATDDFMEHADTWLKRTVWSEPCTSWFKSSKADGTLTVFPGSRVVMADMLATPMFEDYKFEYWSRNRFAFLGNGFSTLEYDGSDIAWYLGNKGEDGLLPESLPRKESPTAINGDSRVPLTKGSPTTISDDSKGALANGLPTAVNGDLKGAITVGLATTPNGDLTASY